MLVLQRDKSDAVVITAPNGDRLTIYVVRGGGKLAFDAPETYSINRKEIQDQIDRERDAAEGA
jgi:carbon storage regulator CsrA